MLVNWNQLSGWPRNTRTAGRLTKENDRMFDVCANKGIKIDLLGSSWNKSAMLRRRIESLYGI